MLLPTPSLLCYNQKTKKESNDNVVVDTLPSSLLDSIESLKKKQQKGKELRHAP